MGNGQCTEIFLLREQKRILTKESRFVLRFRAPEPCGKTFTIEDGIRGKLTMPVNDQDIVRLSRTESRRIILRMLFVDHLMRTTHVVRREEWLATLPIHVQLFETMGWELPVYCHTAQLMKIDNGTKRKLSKRKTRSFRSIITKMKGMFPARFGNIL